MFDIWNQSIDIVEEIYNTDNYVIKTKHDCQNGVCYIFFSSNNIWFLNTEEAFKYSFVSNDYYEWRNFERLSVEKMIFIRDIYKSWYVTGINSRIDSVDSLIKFLKRETEGMKIITVGSSARGYMAALMAACLHAEYSICFSGQYDLTLRSILDVNPFLKNISRISTEVNITRLLILLKSRK